MNPDSLHPLAYATSAALPTRQSRYAFASLLVSAVSVVWLALTLLNAPLPFDGYEQHRIGTVASVLGLILSLGAYWEPNRKRTVAHVAILFAAMVFLAYFWIVPL
jgi:hypothetical protein